MKDERKNWSDGVMDDQRVLPEKCWLAASYNDEARRLLQRALDLLIEHWTEEAMRRGSIE